LSLWLLNFVYLRANCTSWKTLSPWLALAGFAVTTAALISAARREVFDVLALCGGYATTAALMWIGLAALAVTATSRIFRDSNAPRMHRGLGWVNIGTAVVLLPLYVLTNMQVVEEWADKYGNPLGHGNSTHIEEVSRCIERFPLTGDTSCLCEEVSFWVSAEGTRLYQLAACRFSPFSDVAPQSVLPDSYVAGSPVLVSSPRDALSLYAREWMLQEVPEDLTFHISRERDQFTAGCNTRPLENLWTSPSPQLFETISTVRPESGDIWYVSVPEARYDSVVFDRMRQIGYQETAVGPAEERYKGSRFRLYRFTRFGRTTKD
jgi:hypothetical protein